jgi:hypothetical protein
VLPAGHDGDCDLTAALDPDPYPKVVPAAAIHACIDAKHDVGTRHEDGVLASATCHTCGTVYSGAGGVGSGEPTEEAPMSAVEREELTLAGRLGMARARYEGAVIAVHEAEVEGRDIHAQEVRRKPPKGSLGAELAELRAYRANAEQHLADVRDELRRQVDAQERRAKRAEQERDDYRAAHRRAEMVRCWTNEDGKRFVFADELFQALEIPRG